MIFNPAPGNVPSNLPQPNSPGGGGSPTTSSPTLEESLSLVPSGLVAVSVFPPFETPRTVPAVGVIFKVSTLKIVRLGFFYLEYCEF